jgi:hypothetical protein
MIATLLSLTMGAGAFAAVAELGTPAASAALATTPLYSLPLALQESLYFYDAQRQGYARTLGEQPLEWRSDSETSGYCVPLQPLSSNVGVNMSSSFISQYKSVLDPNGKGCLDLGGGYDDAGDTVVFGLPQSYAASVIAWSMHEFPSAFKNTGTWAHSMDILKWFTDEFLQDTYMSNGSVIAYCYQVGEGGVDHSYWGPAELQSQTTYPRDAHCATPENPASDQVGSAVAALAAMAVLTASSDATYSSECLTYAKALYAFGQEYPGLGYSGGFYGSGDYASKMAWAAVWLYIATGTEQYITDIAGTDSSGNYTGWMSKIISSTANSWNNSWVMCWDARWGGVFSLLDPIAQSDSNLSSTVQSQIHFFDEWQVEYWAHVPEANGGTDWVADTPEGFGVINTWGSARYNTAAELEALVFAKNFPSDTNDTAFIDWAMGQMNYLMGDNTANQSFIVGFGSTTPYVGSEVGGSATAPSHPHQGGAQSSFDNSQSDPATDPHILWGALVGGPDSNDGYQDVTTNFVDNEVAVDYNAAFEGALAGLYQDFGQSQTVTNFVPPPEAANIPYYATVTDNQESTQSSQLTINVNNYAIEPPHYESDMSVRYYFDISSLYAHGQGISAISTPIYYDAASTSDGHTTTIGAPVQWGGSSSCVYYLPISWSGDTNLVASRAFEFGIVAAQASDYKTYWSPSSSWGYQGVAKGTYSSAPDPYIPVYLNGKLAYGETPPLTEDTSCGSSSSTTTTTATTTAATTTTTPSTTAPTSPTGSAPSSGGCTVSYEVGSSWTDSAGGSYFTADVTVTNDELSSWTNIAASPVSWNWPGSQQLAGSWDATASQSGTTVTATMAGDNVNVIPPGGSEVFGVEGSGTAAAPSAVSVDGVACTLGTVNLTPPGNPVPASTTNGSSAATTTAATTTTAGPTTTTKATTTAGSTPTATASSGGSCTAGYSITSQWTGSSDGFGAVITVTNSGSSSKTGWTVTWTFVNGQTITSYYDADVTQSGSSVMATNESYNGTLAVGASTQWGFQGTWNGTNAVPTLTCT